MLFVSLLLFLVITPFVVLYAIGYRLSPQDVRAIPVGVLLLDTIPTKADVYLENVYIGRTPRSVPNIPPGTALVSLRKEGYVSWEKHVPVQATLTSEFRHMRLFPEKPDMQTIRQSAAQFSLAPNDRFIALVEKNTSVVVVNTTGEVIASPKALPFTPQKLLWSPDSNMVLALGAKRSAAIDITEKPAAVLEIAPVTATSVIGWDPSHPGTIFYQAPEAVFTYTLATRTGEVFAPLRKAGLSDESIIGLSGSTIASYNLSGEPQQTLASNVPVNIKQLLVAPTGAVATLAETGTVSVVESSQLKPILEKVLEAMWSPDGTVLAFKTAPNELYVYNVSNESLPYAAPGTQQLVLRLSRPLTGLAWYAGSHYMLYQVNDELTITEMDTRDHAIQYTVDTTNTGKALGVATADGSMLYYLKKTAAGTALVSAVLMPK